MVAARQVENRPGRHPRPLCEQSATELAAKIRDGEVTSREVVDAHIARIEQVNPQVNAVVADRFELARREADAADETLRLQGPANVGHLHGVPCTVKECFQVEGMPNTAGLVARRGRLCSKDAVTVQRLKRAGAIVLGVTNTSEICLWVESNNRVYGRSNNPYNLSRIAGGSSGGEGAIIGSGGSPFGLASDIGGSIRNPSFFNGIFGHKPSGGRVPNSGQWPAAAGEANLYLTPGPMARRAEDLYTVLRTIAGPDGVDRDAVEMELPDPRSVDVSKLRIIDIEDDGLIPVSPDLRRAQRRVADHLGALGCTIKRVKVPALKHSFEVWSATVPVANEGTVKDMLSDALGDGQRMRRHRELPKWLLRRSPYTFPTIMLSIAEAATTVFSGHASKMKALGEEIRDTLNDLCGDDGVILYPSYSSPAPRHGAPVLMPLNWVYPAIFNVTRQPATQVPVGLNRDGLPLGVQVAAAHGNDHLTLAVALALEAGFGGWRPPLRISKRR